MSIKLNRKGAGLAGEDRVKENQNLEMIEQEFGRMDAVKEDSAAARLSALEALAKADAADSLSKNVQTQLNTIVVEGDSSPQATQASVGAGGEDYGGNLKARLDAEYNAVTTQLDDIVINVKSFGAKGDWNGTTGTDDTLAIRNAISYASTLGIGTTLFFPHAQGYIITDSLNVPRNINVKMEAPVVYDGANDRSVLNVGDTTGYNMYVNLKLWAINKNLSDWTNENCIGIRVQNAFSSKVEIVQSFGFTIGYETLANGWGSAYNETTIGYLRNNKICLQVAGQSNGWNNANVYYGGLFTGADVGINAGKSVTGIKMLSKDGTYKGNNGNVFYAPRIELGKARTSPGMALPFHIIHGHHNKFLDIRAEENDVKHAAIIEEGYDNEFSYLTNYESNAKVFTKSKYFNNYILPVKERLIFDSGNLAEKAVYHSDYKVHVPGIGFGYYYDTKQYETSPGKVSTTDQLDVEIMPDYIKLMSLHTGASIFIDTREAKDFVVKPDLKSGNTGIAIVCYGEDGTILKSTFPVVEDDWKHNAYIKSLSLASDYAGYGGGYKDTTKFSSEISFKVKEEVKEVRIIFLTGDNGVTNLKGFKIYSRDNAGSCHSKTVNKNRNIVSKIPVIGKWTLGKEVYYENPVAGGYMGVLCTVTGEASSGAWLTNTAYVFHKRVNVDNRVYRVTVAGTSGTIAPTHTSGTATDGTVTWEYLGTLAVFKEFGAIQA